MIYFETKAYAKVWKMELSESGKYIDLQISTSEKDEEGNYVNSSWFARCIGKAVNTLKNLQEGDRIIIYKGKITNERKKQDDGTYRSFFRFLIFEAEIAGSERDPEMHRSPAPAAKAPSTPRGVLGAEDDESPW